MKLKLRDRKGKKENMLCSRCLALILLYRHATLEVLYVCVCVSVWAPAAVFIVSLNVRGSDVLQFQEQEQMPSMLNNAPVSPPCSPTNHVPFQCHPTVLIMMLMGGTITGHNHFPS